MLKFNNLLSDSDLHDTWRLFHPEGKALFVELMITMNE